jgi:asparagine synthase (glutamine-hydrolysing)
LETAFGQDYFTGRVFTGGLNPEPQPLVAGDHVVWFDGQIFPSRSRHGCTATGDEALQLLRDAPSSFADLDGVFALATFDVVAAELSLVTDRLGFRPLYYVETPDWFAYAPEVRGLLTILDKTPPLDEVSLRQFFAFDHMLGNRTWWRQIELVPPGSIWRISAAGRQEVRYWTFDDIRHDPRPEADVIDEMARLWTQAITQSRRPGVTPLLLSGGLDSRLVLAELRRQEVPVVTLSFGTAGCADIAIARRCADLAGVSHHALTFDIDTWWLGRDGAIASTDGLVNAMHLHVGIAGAALRTGNTVGLINIAGDSLFGGGYVERGDLPSGQGVRWQQLTATLLARSYQPNPFFSQDEVIAASGEDANMYLDGYSAECFFHRHRQRRFILNGALAVAPYCEMSYPGVGLPMFRLLLGGTLQEERRENRLYTKFLLAHYPEYFARIPWQATGRRLGEVPARFGRGVRHALRPILPLASEATSGPFVDYAALVRASGLQEKLRQRALVAEDALGGTVGQALASPQVDARVLLGIVTLETYLRQTMGIAGLPASLWNS